MAITDPRDISGLLAWYSPEHEAANYTDGDPLTTVTDLSGNDNHMTCATVGSANPLFKATGGPTGGAERFRFENGGYGSLPSGVMGSATAGEIMTMVKGDYNTSEAQGWMQFGTDSAGGHYPFSSGLYDGFGTTARKSSSYNGFNVWHNINIWSAASDYNFNIDGVSQQSSGSNTVAWATVPIIGNGVSPAGSAVYQTFEGDHGAIVVYNRKLTSGERSDLTTWMDANPSGGTLVTIPQVTGDLTGTGTMSTGAVLAVVTGALTGTGTMSATVDNATAPVFSSADERVPLTIRIGNKHITREVSGLQFRKEAVGGLKSISLRLARPLDRFDPDLAPFSEVIVYDGRSAELIAQGRLTDPGRSASAGDGQQWDMVAFPPGLTDRTFPYVLVDQGHDGWRRSEYSTGAAKTGNDERGDDIPTLVVEANEGTTVVAGTWTGDWINRVVRRAGMKLARVRCDWDAGLTSSNYELSLRTRTGSGATPGAIETDTADTAGGTITGKVGDTNFTNGHDVASLRVARVTADATPTGDTHRFVFYDISVRSMLKDATGADITTGYTVNYVLAHEVVNDLLGRVLDQLDGTNSTVDTGGTYQIDQMSYPDGVTAEQVLTDLMALEPAYRWWIEPDGVGGYVLHWEPWSTTVRYEVTLNGGGDFPASSRELYNEVTVRWVDREGRPRTVTRTGACQILDDRGITRSTIIDASDEIGSAAAATRLGDNFLTEHNVPANAGTINIDRPIRDLLTGRMVRPHQIQEAALIRVRGIESYADALNPDSRDGQTIFRIWSVTYNSDSDNAACELDIPSRSTTNALVKLAKRRNRKR